MTLNERQRLVEMLRESLELLAAPAAQQVAWLQERSMDISDELALQFDDDYRMAEELERAGALTPETVALLGSVDHILDAMGDEDSSWSLGALATDPRWERIRSGAAAALQSMHVPA